MGTNHGNDAGRSVRAGLAFALAATLVSASGCLSAEPGAGSGQPVDESTGEAEGAITNVGMFRCTLASGTILGSLLVRPDGTCHRYDTVLTGASKLYCPQGACVSCWSLAHSPPECILDN